MPRKTDSNNPVDWIFFAETDLEGLKILAERQVSYYLCQSKLAEVLEKVLKAELIRLGWFLERIHDLQKLIDELKERKSDLVDEAQSLGESLTEVYFADRYPGFDLEDPDWPDYREKLEKVNKLLKKVKKHIGFTTV